MNIKIITKEVYDEKIFQNFSFFSNIYDFFTSCKKNVTGSFQGKAKGHNGDVVIDVDIENSKIKNVSLKESVETEDVGAIAINKLIEKVNSSDFNLDIVTGATYSSEAFISAFADALKKAGLNYKNYLKKMFKSQKEMKKKKWMLMLQQQVLEEQVLFLQ